MRVLKLLALALTVCSAQAGSLALVQDASSRVPARGLDALAERTIHRWPRAGAVHASYDDDGRNLRKVGYDFATGAWYFQDNERILGRDTAGRAYSALISRDEYNDLDPPVTNGSYMLDAYFPGVGIAEMLADDRAPKKLVAGDGEKLTLEVMLPRASRALLLENIPKPELERWGGAEGVLRRVAMMIDAQGAVRSVERDTLAGIKIESFDVAECSIPGFQVVEHPWPEDPTFRLVDCEFESRATTQRFDGHERLQSAVAVISTKRTRTPVVYHPDETKPPPVPLYSEIPAAIRVPWLGVIGVTCLLGAGVILWVRKRCA
ncbi:MAG TPA: hypothetical protein VK176_02925 [Phycisphaerales bacterium]|nr:hypothetical protein [Phycisphaerales bacterium]